MPVWIGLSLVGCSFAFSLLTLAALLLPLVLTSGVIKTCVLSVITQGNTQAQIVRSDTGNRKHQRRTQGQLLALWARLTVFVPPWGQVLVVFSCIMCMGPLPSYYSPNSSPPIQRQCGARLGWWVPVDSRVLDCPRSWSWGATPQG